MGQRIKVRRDTSANWAASTVLLVDGEQGYDKTLKQYKTGNGIDLWPALAWVRIDAAQVDNLPASLTAAQVDSQITATGYQTAAQVDALVVAKNYQTAAQVDALVVAKNYQTAAQVTALVIDGGTATG